MSKPARKCRETYRLENGYRLHCVLDADGHAHHRDGHPDDSWITSPPAAASCGSPDTKEER